MPKTRKEKEEIIKELIDKLNRIKSIIFTSYRGLTVNEIQDLREKMREKDIEYKVVKNTLFRIAQAKSDLKEIKIPEIKEPLAFAFGYEDEVMPAKIVKEFSEEHKALKIVGGILDKRLLTKEETEELAKIPTKEELLAKMVSTIKSPLSGLVNVLRGNLDNLVNVLRAISQKE